jgi:hypothetical protein
MKSYVYVIVDPSGYCKVGKADNVNSRLRGLQTGNPRKLKVYYKHPCKNKYRAQMLEQLTHANLKESRAIGEWFSCTPSEAKAAIRRVANEYKRVGAGKDVENVLESEGLCD